MIPNKKIRLSLNISWEPGSQVPREFAALAESLDYNFLGLDLLD